MDCAGTSSDTLGARPDDERLWCIDCRMFDEEGVGWCMAFLADPDKAALIEPPIIYSEAARGVKSLCGWEGRWFFPKNGPRPQWIKDVESRERQALVDAKSKQPPEDREPQ